MINGLFFSENGVIQQIGTLQSLSIIIKTMQEMLPKLQEQETQQVLKSLSDNDLRNELLRRSIQDDTA